MRGRREPLRVLICDDHLVYRLGLRTLISQVGDFVVVGESADPEQAWSQVTTAKPHVALVGQRLSGSGTFALVRRLDAGGIGVVVLADTEDERDLIEALRAGARGYLPRRAVPQRLLNGIRAVAGSQTALDSSAVSQLTQFMNGTPAIPPQRSVPALPLVDGLTARQREVARLVAEGLSNAEVADSLYVSQATVKSHLTIILKRMNLRNRTQLSILVNRNDLVDHLPPSWD